MSKQQCLIVLEDGFEALDFFHTKLRMAECRGLEMKKIADQRKKYVSWQGMHNAMNSTDMSSHSKKEDDERYKTGDTATLNMKLLSCEPDITFDQVDPKQVKLLIVPGGMCSSDKLRTNKTFLDLVTRIYKNGGIVSFIGHAAWIPISSQISKGRNITGFHSLKDDVINSGASWSDQGVTTDKNLITCQDTLNPPDFFRALEEIVKSPK